MTEEYIDCWLIPDPDGTWGERAKPEITPGVIALVLPKGTEQTDYKKFSRHTYPTGWYARIAKSVLELPRDWYGRVK
jgi:hypothetical protein